jgi:Beta-galactosidase trimerisation domain
VPFDVVDDVTLERENLQKYAALLLPNVACMSDRTAARIREYVRSGGGLFATFETSLYDETGTRREEPALAALFGTSGASRVIGPKRWDFMKPRSKSPLLAGLDRELIPAPVYHLRVRPHGADVLLQFTKPLAGVYDGIPVLSDDPALVVNRHGKGKAIYCAGDLGNGINGFHLAEFLTLLGNAVGELAPSQVVLENAPSSIEVVIRSQNDGKRLVLHLINFTGEMTRPIRRVTSLENLAVSLPGLSRPARIFTLVQPGAVEPEWTGGNTLRFVLPRLEEYEVVVIEL